MDAELFYGYFTEFTHPVCRLVGGGGREFRQVDFTDPPFTAVGVGGGFALADVGGDGVLTHTGPACGVRDRGARGGIFGKISLIVGFFARLS